MADFPEDLAGMFVPPNEENSPRYVIGVLEQWDPTTFQNVVRYRGAQLHNLAVMNGIEALSFVPGINVSLLGMSGTGALVSYAILGRYIDPGDEAATSAIQALQSTVAVQIADEIAAARLFAASEPGPHSTSSTTLGALTGGPEVTATIGTSGRCLVHLACSGDSDAGGIDVFVSVGWRMSFEVTGATSVAPSVENSLARLFQIFTDGTGAVANSIQDVMRAGNTVLLEGLNPGVHTFAARYASLFSGEPVAFSNRTIVVEAF